MPRKYRVAFNISNSMFWYKGGKIIFNEDNFELRFLWKTKCVVDYQDILTIKMIRKNLSKCIWITTNQSTIYLICPKRALIEFKNLGFNIDK